MDNKDKSNHGKKFKEAVERCLSICLKRNYIIKVKKKHHCGFDGHNKQFSCPFLITFADGEQWAIFSSTSLRERFKANCWDTQGIKAVEQSVTKSIFVYPSVCNDLKDFESLRDNVSNHKIVVPIDNVIPDNQVVEFIGEYSMSNKSTGSKTGLRGNTFEHDLADVLEYPDNLERWVLGTVTSTGSSYIVFKTILDKLEKDGRVEKNSIHNLISTSKIKRLPSKGPAKTDVLLKVINADDLPIELITFSCKRTSKKLVTVHEYSASDFSKVLNEEDRALADLLEVFQKSGGIRAFNEENTLKLTAALKPYYDKLCKWVLGGIGGYGDPKTQWAEYLILQDDNGNTTIHTIQEYIDLMKNRGVTGQFGTPFNWTFSSGKKGEKIQLKMKVIG